MAIASTTMSASLATAMVEAGSTSSERTPAIATKPSANHGIVMGGRACFELLAPAAPERANHADRMTRKGASIITRTIFAMTAVSAAESPIAWPAATTCATSWIVEPAQRPYVVADTGWTAAST